ncbi:MAG: uroporphyrinogen decarboxylase [Bacteroidota bacterium]|nr:uroporphyrinogen decarboxylase [Bacteroidota bacterium]
MNNGIFPKTINGIKTSRPPVWLMRQAGRVLPSYLMLKEKYSFQEMMMTPEIAAEVTLLPVCDLGVDAAILFSDILVIPHALGMEPDFTDNGPVFHKPLSLKDNPAASLKPDVSKLNYICDTIDKIILKKPVDIPLIGFCGAPFTVFCYMVQGPAKNENFTDAVKYLYTNKSQSKKIIEAITELSKEYAYRQIKHGATVFQLFDTHAGLIPFELYQELFFRAVKEIADVVRNANGKFIFFPKGIGTGIMDINFDMCDFLSIDWQIPLTLARKLVDENVGLQGNLDPRILFSDKKTIESELNKYIEFGSQNQNWIFNLGHGLMPGIPFENVKFVVDWVKNTDWKR